MVIHGIVGASIEVPAADIVDVAVLIIIVPVTSYLTGIEPDISCKVRMRVIHAGINDGNNDIGTSRSRVPCFRCFDVCSRNAARLTCIVQSPLRGEGGIVWNQRINTGLRDEIWFCINRRPGALFKGRHHAIKLGDAVIWKGDQIESGIGQVPPNAQAKAGDMTEKLGFLRAVLQSHKNVVSDHH